MSRLVTPRTAHALVLATIVVALTGAAALLFSVIGAGTEAGGGPAPLHAAIGAAAVALALVAGLLALRATRRIEAVERKARACEQRFHDVAELAADWVWETDPDLRFSYMTDRVEDVAGRPKSDLLGRPPWGTDAAPLTREWADHVAAMQRRERLENVEFAIGAAGGERRTIRISGKPVFGEDGAFLGYRGTGSDVTAETAARRAAEAQRELLETTLENLGHGITVVDSDLRAVMFNRRFLELLDFPEGEFALGDRYEKFIRYNCERGEYGPGDVEEMVRERVALARSLRPHHFERTRPDGTVLDIRGQPLPSGGFVTTYRDITSRKQAEAARREAEERLWAVLDGSPEPVSLKDTRGRYVLCNRAFEALTGVPRERLPGMTDDQVFPGQPEIDERVRRHEAEVIRSHSPVSHFREWRDREGRMRFFVVSKFPVFDAERELVGVGTFNQEVTELRNAEAQLRQAQKMQALGQLTGGVAHDFNNLLAVILGNLELLEERTGADPATHDLALAAIGAARRGAALTQRLLAFARQQPLTPQVVDLRELLDGMSHLLRQSVGDGIRLELRTPPGLWPVYVDPAQLENALLNLAINARDAMPEGGTLVFEAANAGAEADSAAEDTRGGGRFVTVSVSDDGTGMAPETVDRAFEPFFTTKPVGKGSGLGLSMVYGFVRQSGGEAKIASTPGRGTRVDLVLPAGAAPDREAPGGRRDKVSARRPSRDADKRPGSGHNSGIADAVSSSDD